MPLGHCVIALVFFALYGMAILGLILDSWRLFYLVGTISLNII